MELDLTQMKTRDVLRRAVNKIITEMVSVKFELLVFIGWATWSGKIEPIYGIPAMLLLVGIKEGAEVISKFTGK